MVVVRTNYHARPSPILQGGKRYLKKQKNFSFAQALCFCTSVELQKTVQCSVKKKSHKYLRIARLIRKLGLSDKIPLLLRPTCLHTNLDEIWYFPMTSSFPAIFSEPALVLPAKVFLKISQHQDPTKQDELLLSQFSKLFLTIALPKQVKIVSWTDTTKA